MSEKLKPDFNVVDKTTLVDQQPIKDSFIDTLVRMHRFTPEDSEATYERESRYFKRLVSQNDWLKESTGISLCSAFFEVAITGLSLQPGSKSDSYLEARAANQPKEGRDNWVKVARLVVTAYGELNLRIKSGQIIRMNNPIVIYDGDKFQPCTNERGELKVDYLPAIPRKTNKIIGAYVCIVLPHNGLDFKWLLEDDITRLANYSKTKTQKDGNSLYKANDGQIDPGFLEAKCIKHAMRAYTKLKVSENISFEGDEQEEIQPKTFVEEIQKTATIQITNQTDEEEIF